MNIRFCKPYIPNLQKYKSYVDKICKSGHLTNGGPFVMELQERLSDYLDVKNLLLVSTGTTALEVAYRLLGLSGEVITTPFSFVATTNSLLWMGLEPRFVDIDHNTFNIDNNKIHKEINKDTSAIVAVHAFGNACNIEEIQKIAKKNSLNLQKNKETLSVF